MALRMTERDVNGVTVVDIEGRIVLGEESNAFRERVKGLLAAGKKKIVLNLANVTYIDSSGPRHAGGDVPQRALAGRDAEARKPGLEIQGSAPGDQADHRVRHLRQRNRRDSKLRSVTSTRNSSRRAAQFDTGRAFVYLLRCFYSLALPSTLKIATPLSSFG